METHRKVFGLLAAFAFLGVLIFGSYINKAQKGNQIHLPEVTVHQDSDQEIRKLPEYIYDGEVIRYNDKVITVADPESFKLLAFFDENFEQLVPKCDKESIFWNQKACSEPIDHPDMYAFDDVNIYKNAEKYIRRDNANKIYDDRFLLLGNRLIWAGRTNSHIRELVINDPKTLEHVGGRFFKDSVRIYFAGNVMESHLTTHVELGDLESVDPDTFKILSYPEFHSYKYVHAPYLEKAELERAKLYESYMVIDGKAYNDPERIAYVQGNNSIFKFTAYLYDGRFAEELMDSDPETFEILEGGYSKDANYVYYNADTLLHADPSTFVVKEVPSKYGKGSFNGQDADSVYMHGFYLEGLTPEGVIIEGSGSILRDGDVVWFSTGGCHGWNYTKGTPDDIATYVPPC